MDREFGGREKRIHLEKGLLWKIDLRMSILIVIYILNYIDRNNAAAARLKGFEADLGLVDNQFATLLSILYVGYIIMQVPSNMILNWMGKPSIYLPCCMIIWGMISVLTGITTNFTGALLTRFFLGFVEAAFFPGALFLLSKWYTRKELGFRTAILYCGNLISNAFGGLIAAGILSGMQGALGHAAWRWLFYIEGALTMFVAVCAIFILPDFPATTSWLSEEERKLAEWRMAEDASGSADEDASKGESQLRGLVLALTDWKVWFLACMMTAEVVGLSFNAYFRGAALTATLGYNTTVSLLLVAPPWAFAVIVAFVIARHADWTGERAVHISGPLFLGIIGFIIALSTTNTAARYVSFFLMAQAYAGYIVCFAWLSNTLPRPPAKRAVSLAFINAFSQLGNVAGSYVFPSNWGPTYDYSFAICLAMFGTSIIMVVVLRTYLKKENERMDRGERVAGAMETQEEEEELRRTAELEGVSIELVRANRSKWRYLY
ncbi:MFS general substrate transporter [Dacryopinax primogenitus]|uniref:MFS general substrate transporter n=1 Tax=Dacryopinax primogenitus (strain DJM 731) TaxID=1858805 RepID=M5FNI7_DACPD|nr:MFS general substrate transporter [Dacryopinax primogenitus]EJT97515.1 MFS general substrate transporter [Dacryopinax primogenitus]